jgi:hypothetical protein
MNSHRWRAHDGTFAEVFLNDKRDIIISKYCEGIAVGSAFFPDLGIVPEMPRVMRYCLEQEIDLSHNNYFNGLGMLEESREQTRKFAEDIEVPLKSDEGIIRASNGNLLICSSSKREEGIVSFHAKDAPRVIEGVYRVLDAERIMSVRDKCLETIQSYMAYYYMRSKESRVRPKQ